MVIVPRAVVECEDFHVRSSTELVMELESCRDDVAVGWKRCGEDLEGRPGTNLTP